MLTSAQLIPGGTRVTTVDGSLTFETIADAYVDIGNTTVDVAARCQTEGNIGNGYLSGQISAIVDVFPYQPSESLIPEGFKPTGIVHQENEDNDDISEENEQE